MKWEYKTLKLEHASGWFGLGGNVDEAGIDKEMNRMGKEGWELVSALDTNSSNGATRFVILIFKRPL
jgi:hypothetical protein